MIVVPESSMQLVLVVLPPVSLYCLQVLPASTLSGIQWRPMLPESSRMNMRFGSTEVLDAVPSGTDERSVCAAPAGGAPSAVARARVANRERAEW